MEKKSANVMVRPKRQITLPRDVCERLGIGEGDILELIVEDSILTARPRKAMALESLKEIQDAFRRSEISEEELKRAGRRVRKNLAEKRYGAKR